MKYREGVDYWVYRVEFPNAASESVAVSNGDGTFTIYLNTLFSEERLEDRLQHELRHLEEEHFFRDDLEIQDVERQADGIATVKSESVTKKEPELLPDVFDEHPEGTIPLFSSLESFKAYMLAMRRQYHALHRTT